MAKSGKGLWKLGRGKLGFMEPLLGTWVAEADSPMGPLRCRRVVTEILNGSCIQLEARWEFGAARGGAAQDASAAMRAKYAAKGPYQELAIYAVGDDGVVTFWSFTSDGKRSVGTKADVSDVHPEAIGFEAEMPAGRARMVYWPDEKDGFHWAVEAKNKTGWRRFTEHHYLPE